MSGAGLPARVVLVGFMAAGKSTVGRRVAAELDRPFVDLDEAVEELAGRPVPEIFREEGEAVFRGLEARATRELDDRGEVVVAAGGGWMARPELRDRWEDAVRIWLRVDAREAVRRLEGRLTSRPMLDPDDPVGAARRLLEGRREAYALAEHSVDTVGRGPEEVTRAVLERLRAGTR